VRLVGYLKRERTAIINFLKNLLGGFEVAVRGHTECRR